MPRIFFESDDVLALDKPSGLIVHSDGRTVEPSVAEWLLERYPALAGVGEPWISPQGERVLTAGIVHRLDRSTSGVLVVAKTATMHAYLKQQFKERRVEKIYLAYVYGHMEEGEGTIVAQIVRTSAAPRCWAAHPAEKHDKRAAITQWRVSDRLKDPATGERVSLLEVKPETGRTHQIRVHLASIGHPIIADHLYAGDRTPLLVFRRPALHAASISFVLPVVGRRTFFAPLPEDFQQAGTLLNSNI